MTEFYYADGKDKSGNTLITSYKKEDQARKYRAGASIQYGQRFFSVDADGTGIMSPKGDMLLRTMMVRGEETVENEGPFHIWAKSSGVWVDTGFRRKTYAAANTMVKSALIEIYEACAVIEEE